jgi:hypothetical protein
MSASEESESPSPSKPAKISFKSPVGPNKSLLTHAREHVENSKPVSEAVPPVSDNNAEDAEAGARGKTESTEMRN